MQQKDPTDILGQPITDPDERDILRLFREVEAMADRDDLAPCVLMNLREAKVMLWNACCDLDLIYEEPA